MSQQWDNRIVGYDARDPRDLAPNRLNWRSHPDDQRAALRGTIGQLGWIQDVIVNRRTAPLWGAEQGRETILDGHCRIEEALATGQATVPVKYVDLAPHEEALALMTLDPIGAMAGAEAAQYEQLARGAQAEDAAVQQLIAAQAEALGIVPADAAHTAAIVAAAGAEAADAHTTTLRYTDADRPALAAFLGLVTPDELPARGLGAQLLVRIRVLAGEPALEEED
jgi:hypothetical protein